ncbi:protein-tyrosine-phosphatase [Neolewinella aurantiaca]|uniref:Protein-tyrosine-phosphatase n=1 Tax=Neolewinella aurantiaca TaxID=2602767 RepID=A0A5C7FES8_9BACT|nr:protein-tyrosine-phosphatase [Neolewinella aurantiaca]TXF88026.1 protein-tyrosine-phosphatase [Neolewinella aurantiaca]
MSLQFFPQLDAYIKELTDEETLIPQERKELLLKLSGYIQKKKGGPVQLNFICTHNSRRSHLAQIWASVAAAWFGLEQVTTFSGGTEATAFNPRAVAALQRAGFDIVNPGGENPHYRVKFGEAAEPLECWSKTFDDPANPEGDFAAIMTCSDADENCPFIPGVDLRLPLTYEDPKVADDTPQEAERYDERVRQIGREIFFALSNAR